MEKLFDETFALEDQSVISRNLWYGYIELYTDGEFGKNIVLNKSLEEDLTQIVKHDVAEPQNPAPTEINWYFYGQTKTADAIGDEIRPTIMIRYQHGAFLVRCNISDNDFAVNIDSILSFEQALAEHLSRFS